MSNGLTKRAQERVKNSGLAESFLLPEESLDEFYDLCSQLFIEYRPCGASEESCVLSIAKLLWRKIRPHPSLRLKGGQLEQTQISHEAIVGWSMPADADKLSPRECEAVRAEIDLQVRAEAKERYVKEMEQNKTPELNLDVLRTDGKWAAKYNAQISATVQRLLKLKQMKRRAG